MLKDMKNWGLSSPWFLAVMIIREKNRDFSPVFTTEG
jgi:hypothetical protein